MQTGSFGDIIFETSAEKILTIQDLDRSCSARFEEHKVLGAKPRLEFLSPELLDVGFKVCLRADLGVNPQTELEKLEALCVDGKYKKLIIAGINFGNFVLTSVCSTYRHTLPNGAYIIDVTLKFKEYV